MMRPILLALAFSAFAAAAGPDGRVPVIVELFTSEGCSSCPPADAVLAKLARTQPVQNAHVIVLSEHVDYWNNLGWVDPFSSPQFRARQNDYARAFGVDSVYTPMMIVNGTVQFVGDDFNRAVTEIGKMASAQGSASVRLQTARNEKDHELVDLGVSIKDVPPAKTKNAAPIDVLMAITEDNLASDVQRGENAGHRLRHVAVVRSFGSIGKLNPPERTLSLRPTLKFPSNWKRQDLHAVVFLQDHSTQLILGAESVDIN
jgi:hypothetical protein